MKAINVTAEYLRPLVPARGKDSHKGDYGKALIVAGSKGMTGAAVLAARAALKAGAGLVTVAVPDSERPIVARAVPEAMTLPLPSKDGAAALKAVRTILAFQAEKKYDVCLVGPGLSLKGEAPEFITALLKKINMPVVADADALNALARTGGLSFLKNGPPRIFTPHAGEAARLLKGSGLAGGCRFGVLSGSVFFAFPRPPAGSKKTDARHRAELSSAVGGLHPTDTRRQDLTLFLLKLQELLGGTCILKGPGTLITDGRRLLRNTTGGPELAKGGSGDVLAGLITGLWAQTGRSKGFNPATAFDSAALGVYLHGLCGGLAAKKLTSRCVLAGELTDFLPAAFRKLLK